MMSYSKEIWVGSIGSFGIVQRLGVFGFLISLAIVCLSFDAPGNASVRYWLFVAAHATLWIGFAVAAVADRLARRPFSIGRLVYSAGMGFAYAVLGPIVMAAAAAANFR